MQCKKGGVVMRGQRKPGQRRAGRRAGAAAHGCRNTRLPGALHKNVPCGAGGEGTQYKKMGREGKTKHGRLQWRKKRATPSGAINRGPSLAACAQL